MTDVITMDFDNFLEHHGVKGMKWGQKRALRPSDSAIVSARGRVDAERRQLNRQADRANLAKGKQQEKEVQKYVKMYDAHAKNPDRATALRFTKGEKLLNGVVAVGLPGFGTAAVGIGVAARVSQRKAIEKGKPNSVTLDSQLRN